jgi:hypothetical protein
MHDYILIMFRKLLDTNDRKRYRMVLIENAARFQIHEDHVDNGNFMIEYKSKQ